MAKKPQFQTPTPQNNAPPAVPEVPAVVTPSVAEQITYLQFQIAELKKIIDEQKIVVNQMGFSLFQIEDRLMKTTGWKPSRC